MSTYLVILGGPPGRALFIVKSRTLRALTMVTTLTLHQQDTMVSALNVLLLTLNKTLLGGPPRITRYVLMLISV